jgi:hypothetical protein
VIGAWATVQLDIRNPYTACFWSIAYAGLGHILLDQYIVGFILLLSEIFLNLASNLNLAIFYTLTARFEMARQVLNFRVFPVYVVVYCFAIFDSFREAVLINKTYILASREGAQVNCFAMNTLTFSHLNSVSPLLSATWSAFLPGSGYFIVQKMNRAVMVMALWIANVYLSGFCLAVVHTVSGNHELAKASLDIHWFLNLPSIWFFSVYDGYSSAVQNNKLYRLELSNYLKKEYQSGDFLAADRTKAGVKDGGNPVYAYSVFEHSPGVEFAITGLEARGIGKDAILAVPLGRRREEIMRFNKLNASDETSKLAPAMILGMIGTLLGAIFGFLLAWGPILWGLIGAIAGSILGFGIRIAYALIHAKGEKSQKTGVIVVVRCAPAQAEMVKDALWKDGALGVSMCFSGEP